MSYEIEKRYVVTNSMTVAAAERFYGKKYIITDYFTHWWDSPQNRAKSPMDIYEYMKANNKSVRHILGYDDRLKKIRIIAMTPEDRVPLTQQSGNIYGDSVEVDPLITTNDPRAKELYKALGWLMWQREIRWKRTLRPRLHKEVWSTACSNIDKARVQLECNKWKNGDYNKKENKIVIETSNPVFNADYYLKSNPDVARHQNTKEYAKTHWLMHGIKEGRPSAPNFHVAEYLANYSDLRRIFGDKGYAQAVEHYYLHGINEGRTGRKKVAVVVADRTKELKDKIIEFVKGA